MFAGMFWLFRVVVAVTTSLNINIGFNVTNLTEEIVVLFVALFCLVLIVRKKLIGAIMYIIAYGWYFGRDIVNAVIQIQNGGSLNPTQILNLFIAFVAIIIATLTVVNVGIANTAKGTTKHKKTDWFYKNENFDRKLDERADKNNYKF